MSALGDDIRIYNPTMMDPHVNQSPEDKGAAGGIRVFGGKRFVCVGGSIESGDDCIAFVPLAVGPGNKLGDQSIEDGLVADMVLKGRGSRALNFGLDAGAGGSENGKWLSSGGYYQTGSIRRCRALGIVAEATGPICVAVRNYKSSGVVEDIEITDLTVRAGPDTQTALVVENLAGGVRPA